MSEIKLCERCGKAFNASFRFEKRCYPCHLQGIREEQTRRAQEGEDIECADNPVCPWCGFEWNPDGEESEYFTDGEYMITCPECEKVFCMSTSVSITYDTTRKLPEWMQEELNFRIERRRKLHGKDQD